MQTVTTKGKALNINTYVINYFMSSNEKFRQRKRKKISTTEIQISNLIVSKTIQTLVFQ